MPQLSSYLAVLSVSGALSFYLLQAPALGQPDSSVGQKTTRTEEAERLFVSKVLPTLQEKCSACHGDDAAKREGGLHVLQRESLLEGGDSGKPALIIGQGRNSPLVLAMERTHDVWSAMPPKESERVSAAQIDAFVRWIDTDAPWPTPDRIRAIQNAMASEAIDPGEEVGIAMATSGGSSKAWSDRRYKRSDVWAYQPIPPLESSMDFPATIDALIAERLPPGLTNAPPASPREFMRRATFDLTGLPPRAEDYLAFEEAYRQSPEEAVSKLVDRLLASPHYGERMAQHWLDVVRYADSSGLANDYERGNAWRYRDYVIRSFNQDKPFDQFTKEQIAGDELDSSKPENLIATGFLRMGPWELTGMEVAKIARQRFLDDVTNSVGETFLAHSLQCARCHDHKFDPVPTRDYYSIQAVFATTQFAEREAPFLAEENRAGFDEARFLRMRETDYLTALRELNAVQLKAAEDWFRQSQLSPDVWHREIEKLRSRDPNRNNPSERQATDTFVKAREALRKQGIPEEEIPPVHIGFGPQEHGRFRLARKGLERLRWQQERYLPFAFSVYSGMTPNRKNVLAPIRMPTQPDRDAELERTCILVGGDPFAAGEPVEPGVLSAVSDLGIPIPKSIEGRRKAFAEWLVHPSNPLTARVIANRIWMWHFGEAIAGNPNNFGATGKKPTHPELLDWLAAKLIDERWSIKALHRLIMCSQAYRRSSQHPEPSKLAELDPERKSYAAFRPRRLSAEELRDATLFVTGEWNPSIGGIPCRPEMNLEAALQPRQVMGTFAEAWVPNPIPKERHRRSIYTLRLRGLVDPSLEVFNSPVSDFSCERRDSTLVTPQVYALFHSQQVYVRAVQLAQRALREARKNDQETLVYLYKLVHGRKPEPSEQLAMQEHWLAMERVHDLRPVRVDPQPTVVLREAVEENTGERFQFEERLYANEEFQADIPLESCSAQTLALADIALVLLNSNEFVYVY